MYGPMMDNWGQMWQWMTQMPMVPMMLMLPVLLVAVAVAFVLMARDARTRKLTAPPR